MFNILRADFYRMFCKKPFWLSLLSMLAASVFFCVMQRSAMDYTVPLSRVVFLPMTFYALALAALHGVFIGTDFDDGVLINKITAKAPRRFIYFSSHITCLSASLALYFAAALFSLALGLFLFEADISPIKYLSCLALGAILGAAYSAIFCAVSFIAGKKSRATAVCMALAFLLLFACLETNSAVVQEEYKNGALNPHYIGGFARQIVIYLHDINPYGQAAQLSAMRILNPFRFAAFDALWIAVSSVFGTFAFSRKDL